MIHIRSLSQTIYQMKLSKWMNGQNPDHKELLFLLKFESNIATIVRKKNMSILYSIAVEAFKNFMII